jgi:putative effector of murein hydrolase LrgA (UPF0299 family)
MYTINVTRLVVRSTVAAAILFLAVLSGSVSNDRLDRSGLYLGNLRVLLFVPTAAASEGKLSCEACVQCSAELQVCCIISSCNVLAYCEAVSDTEVSCTCGLDSFTASCDDGTGHG